MAKRDREPVQAAGQMRRAFGSAIHGLGLFVLLFAVVPGGHGQEVTSDFNRDGKPDAWSYMNGGQVEKQEIDVNYDGNIDTVYLYDGQGKIAEETLDTNYDGKMDNWRTYKNGKISLDKIDSDFDGMVDLWVYVDKGGIYRMERDLNGDGSPDDASVY